MGMNYSAYCTDPLIDPPKENKTSKAAKLRLINSIQGITLKSYDEWVETLFAKYMFYHKNGKKDCTGYCECGAEIRLDSAKSGASIVCTVCNQTVKLKNDIYNHEASERQATCFLENTGMGLLQRLFVIYKDTKFTDDNKVKFTYNHYEDERTLINNSGSRDLYHPHTWARSKWYEGPGRTHGMGDGRWYVGHLPVILTFPKNINQLLNYTPFKYSQLKTVAEEKHLNPAYFLETYARFPKVELLVKNGLYGLVNDLIHKDDCKKYGSYTLKQLGIDNKADLDFAIKYKFGYKKLSAYKCVKHWQLNDEKLLLEAVDFVYAVYSHSGEDFKYTFITFKRLFLYFMRQRADYEKYENYVYGYFFRDYTDYISAAIQLELNLNDTAVHAPKSLKHAHDWTNDMLKVLENRIYDIPVAAKYEAYNAYVNFADDKLQISIAKTAEEIVLEGQQQNHCVGRYCERVAKGESLILFLRRVEETDCPFYTVEIKPDLDKLNICQYRGYHNEDKSPEERAEVTAFLAKYEKWFNRRSAKDFDKTSVLMKYYKAVQKTADGKYISNWDKTTEYKIGEILEVEANDNPDQIAVNGIHVASLDFALHYGKHWHDCAILELEVNMHDVVVPDAKDQVRASKVKVLREVPADELTNQEKDVA